MAVAKFARFNGDRTVSISKVNKAGPKATPKATNAPKTQKTDAQSSQKFSSAAKNAAASKTGQAAKNNQATTTYNLKDGRKFTVTGDTGKLSGGGFHINYTGVKTDKHGNVTAAAGSGTRDGKPTTAKAMNGNALTIDGKSGKLFTC